MKHLSRRLGAGIIMGAAILGGVLFYLRRERPDVAPSAANLTPHVYGGGYGDNLILLEQGWDDEARDRFYHEPQGSPIMPYAWFLVLEQPDGTGRFRDNRYLRSFNLITSAGPSTRNPDALPVGFTKDFGIHRDEVKLGMNCAACHTSEVSYRGQAVLIDGGASHFDFWRFIHSLEKSLQQTYEDEAKFKRFAEALLDADDKDTPEQLRARLRSVLQLRSEWSFRNATHVTPGPGRVDALNVILNQATALMLDRPNNARASDAPVSYPPVWDAPYLDRVQYNAVVKNKGASTLGRNVGQVLGVFGELSVIPSTIPPGYASSVRTEHLLILEDTLKTLISPAWGEMAEKDILPAIDAVKAARGHRLYENHCAGCHAVINRLERGELASIVVKAMPLDKIGTDPVAALNFTDRIVDTGPLMGRKTGYLGGQPFCERTHADQILVHLTVAAMMHDLGASGGPILGSLGIHLDKAVDALKDRFDHEIHGVEKSETDQEVIDRMSSAGATEAEIVAALEERSDDKTALYDQLVKDSIDHYGPNRHCMDKLEHAAYRARPLNGVWATGPFLHNGSVPSIADLLQPPAQRPKTFYVGQREIDPVKVGFVDAPGPHTMRFDTSVRGNSNSGHLYGTKLSAEEKDALLEYIKSL